MINPGAWLQKLDEPPMFKSRMLTYFEDLDALQKANKTKLAETIALQNKDDAPGPIAPAARSLAMIPKSTSLRTRPPHSQAKRIYSSKGRRKIARRS